MDGALVGAGSLCKNFLCDWMQIGTLNVSSRQSISGQYKWRIEAVDRPPPFVVVVMGVGSTAPRQAAKGEILYHMTRRNG